MLPASNILGQARRLKVISQGLVSPSTHVLVDVAAHFSLYLRDRTDGLQPSACSIRRQCCTATGGGQSRPSTTLLPGSDGTSGVRGHEVPHPRRRGSAEPG